MTDRRSLTDAVNQGGPSVDTEIMRSFVSQRPLAAKPEGMLKRSKEPAPPVSQGETAGSDDRVSVGSPAPRSATRFQRVGLIPVTVRLRPEIAGALKRASLERELDGEQVFTQQELVEQVLEPWLLSQGYLA